MLTASLRDIAHVNPVELAERIGIDAEPQQSSPVASDAPTSRGRFARGWSALRKVPTIVFTIAGFASAVAGRVLHRGRRARA